MGWWNWEFKACSFAVKMSSFRRAMSVYNVVFCSDFLYFNNSKKLHQKDTLSQVFSCGFCKILRTFFVEHLRTAASKIIKESSPVNSARNGKLYIIILVDVWLGSKWASPQRSILKNRMKNVQNKAMLKC